MTRNLNSTCKATSRTHLKVMLTRTLKKLLPKAQTMKPKRPLRAKTMRRKRRKTLKCLYQRPPRVQNAPQLQTGTTLAARL